MSAGAADGAFDRALLKLDDRLPLLQQPPPHSHHRRQERFTTTGTELFWLGAVTAARNLTWKFKEIQRNLNLNLTLTWLDRYLRLRIGQQQL